MEEKRIYSVSPAVIVPGDGSVRIKQPYGRQSAQHAHAIGMVWFKTALRAPDADYTPTTTILLQCRDSKELSHVIHLLVGARIQHELFYDKNDEAYGPIGNILTSVATHPVSPNKVYHALGYLPLLGGPTE